MEMAKVTSKGQITIPVSIRRRLNIDEGDKLLFIDSPDGVVMVNPNMLPGGQGAAIPSMRSQNKKFPNEEAPDTNQLESIIEGHSPPDDVTVDMAPHREAPTAEPNVDVPTEMEPSPVESSSAIPHAAEPLVEPKTSEIEPTKSIPPKEVNTDVTVSTVEEPPEAVKDDAPIPSTSGSLEEAKADAAALAGTAHTGDAPTNADETKTPTSPTRGFDVNALLDEIRSIGSKI
ncbi:MAG: AbrB/MazE/SpoVT family DNA-binding domain-containing protein [Oscillospiraceae bacterium]|nr:AbrB/MazE/SpoVT family DNA-binding domain-containing protein [Oscillospiraceae bacterium]